MVKPSYDRNNRVVSTGWFVNGVGDGYRSGMLQQKSIENILILFSLRERYHIETYANAILKLMQMPLLSIVQPIRVKN
jgi:hypothetical protein